MDLKQIFGGGKITSGHGMGWLRLPRDQHPPCQRVTLPTCPLNSFKLAEREGFEPPDALRHRLISSQVQSTTLPSLRPTKETPSGFYLKPIR